MSTAPEARAWKASAARQRPTGTQRGAPDKPAAPKTANVARAPTTKRAAASKPSPPPASTKAPVLPPSTKAPAPVAGTKRAVAVVGSKPTPVASFKPAPPEPAALPSKKTSAEPPSSSKKTPDEPALTSKKTSFEPAPSKESTKTASKTSPPPAPSYFRAAKAPPAGASWAPYYRTPWKRGYVTLFGHGKKWSGYLIGSKGEVPPTSRASLSSMLASWRTGKEALIDERLIAMIALASDEFGGRAIRVVSGYREHSYAPDSKHKSGQALDFSIPGVPNDALRDYLRTLNDVGIGFYPNSTHVHLDVRDKTTYWVDYSFPGERPHYAYEPAVRGWGPRERAIADALDHLPSILTETSPPVALSVGKPAPPFAARPAPNRAVFAPVAPGSAAMLQRSPSDPVSGTMSGSAPIVPDGGATMPRTAVDSGAGFWSRAASALPDGGAASPDGGSRSFVRAP